MTTPRIDINMDKPCKKCGEMGATPSGYCLSCAADLILDGKLTQEKAPGPEFHVDWAEADPSVVHMAQELIEKYHPRLKSARIGFLYRKEAPLKNGRYTLGQAQKVNDRLKVMLDYDFLIWVAKDQWDAFTDDRRYALLDHELMHCTLGDAGWKIRPHEIEEFSEIIERWGFWTYDLLKVQEIAKQNILPGFEPAGKVEAVKAEQFAAVEAGEL